jgi:hypothetical protein
MARYRRLVKRTDWEAQAESWIAWSRTPGHDSYHDYGPLFFDQVVPDAGRRTLDLGCGEGRLTRQQAVGRRGGTGARAPGPARRVRVASALRSRFVHVARARRPLRDPRQLLRSPPLPRHPYARRPDDDFSSFTYPLEAYSEALESAGLALERLREPKVPLAVISKDPGEARWSRVPAFLFLLARRIV